MEIPILPEWTKERHQYRFAGIELAAYKHAGGKWRVKIGRCNLCGLCCENQPGSELLPVDKHGTCVYLKTVGTEKICDLGSERPFNCSIGIGRGRVADENCTESFEEID